uniref:LRRCT domain-containing protein n=1 Tax=Mola mola TaxID=94237 RepID=A0A3Q3X4F6_MOLML
FLPAVVASCLCLCICILVMTLILISLPLLKSVEVCPSSCQCLQGGAVKCVGYNITDIPKQILADKVLLLHGNKLETLTPDMFEGLVNLLQLDLSQNNLGKLSSDAFNGLNKLLSLNLGRNFIKKLPPTIFSSLTELKQLGELFLNDNKLQSLPDNIFHGLGQLLLIDLKCNQLKSLTGDIFLSNAVLKTLSLSGNPWDCTCSIRGFAKWIRDNEQVVLDRGYVTCYSPVHRQNSTINSLPEEEFKTCDSFTVTNSPPNKHNLHEPTKTSRPVSTSGQNLVFDSKTALCYLILSLKQNIVLNPVAASLILEEDKKNCSEMLKPRRFPRKTAHTPLYSSSKHCTYFRAYVQITRWWGFLFVQPHFREIVSV